MFGSVLLTWFAPFAVFCAKPNAVGVTIALVLLLLAPLLLNDLLVQLRAKSPDAEMTSHFLSAIAPMTVEQIVAMRDLNLPTVMLTISGQVVLFPEVTTGDEEILRLRAARLADGVRRRVVWIYWAVITLIAATALVEAIALTSIESGWAYGFLLLELMMFAAARLVYVLQGKFAVHHDAAAVEAGHSAETIRRGLTPPADLFGKPLKRWNYLVHRKVRLAALDRASSSTAVSTI
jgi:hypothetical protein